MMLPALLALMLAAPTPAPESLQGTILETLMQRA